MISYLARGRSIFPGAIYGETVFWFGYRFVFSVRRLVHRHAAEVAPLERCTLLRRRRGVVFDQLPLRSARRISPPNGRPAVKL